MKEFFGLDSALGQQFLGNTPEQWMWASIYIAGGIVLSKLAYWVIRNVGKKLTQATKTKMDDLLLDMFEAPFVFGIIILGFYVGLQQLTLPGGADEWVSSIYTALVTINVTWFITRTIGALLDNYVAPKSGVKVEVIDAHLFPLLRKVLISIIWGFGIVIALNNAGYDVSAMIAGLGIGGLALAMAAQDSVSNFFGGFTIFTDHPFKVGDRIVIGGHDGTVFEVGLRCFRMRTLDGTVVVIPNSQATSQVIENISEAPAKKIVLSLGLTYDTTPEKMQQAMDLLLEIGKNNKALREDCTARFLNYGDFSLGINFVYFILPGNDIFAVQSEVNMEILKQFNANGLNFAFPTQTIYTINSK